MPKTQLKASPEHENVFADDNTAGNLDTAKPKSADSGFSLIELIVTVLIMGIIATIAVVSYGEVRNTTFNNVVMTDLRNSSMNLERYYMENGHYPSAYAELLGENLSISKESYSAFGDRFNMFYCVSLDRQEYAIFANSQNDRFSKSSLYGLERGNNIPSSNRPFCTRYLDAVDVPGEDYPYRVLWARSHGEWNY